MTRMSRISAVWAGLLSPLAAHATVAGTVPEPETWALVAIGLVAAAIVKIRNRRK